MGRAVRAVGGIALIGAGLAYGAGWLSWSSVDRTGEVAAEVRRVEIDNDSGDVTIRAGDVRETVVRQHLRYRWDDPGDAYTVDGSTLLLGGCGWGCTVDYDVVVPRGTAVSGAVDSGNVALEGVADVRVEADSGDITLRLDQVEQVFAHADSGDIDLTVEEGAYPSAAGGGPIEAATDSGDITVAVPAGAYRLAVETDSGDRDIGVPQDPAATRVLRLSTDSGDVSVQRRR